MIIKDFYKTRDDGIKLYRIYSDQEFMICQVETGNNYLEAIDIENAAYTYEETDLPIESNSNEVNQKTDLDKISPEEFMALVEEVL